MARSLTVWAHCNDATARSSMALAFAICFVETVLRAIFDPQSNPTFPWEVTHSRCAGQRQLTVNCHLYYAVPVAQRVDSAPYPLPRIRPPDFPGCGRPSKGDGRPGGRLSKEERRA